MHKFGLGGKIQGLRAFFKSRLGNVAITFALVATPLLGAVGAGVDLAAAIKDKVSMQGALDATALAVAKNSTSLTTSQVQPFAQKWFDATFKESDVKNVAVAASYDSNAKIATVSAGGSYPTSLVRVMGFNSIPVTGTAKAKVLGSMWPICVEVTSAASNHTLVTLGTAQINFTNCMVQVNTNNWDAVEARNTSYIHSANGDNCFVGDIHYGDILPAKDITCAFFSDPFAGYAMPASAATCTYTKLVASVAGQVLNPGTYCGGLSITKSATLNPGLYIVRDGDLAITGSGTNVIGNGVTFLFTGINAPGINFNSSAVVNLTAARSGVGNFAGFVFYFDSAASSLCVPPKDGTQVQKIATKTGSTNCVSVIDTGANVTLSGIVYLFGQQFLVQGTKTALTINPGTVIADMIVAQDSAQISLTGTLNSSTSAEIALRKQGTGPSPVLIQ